MPRVLVVPREGVFFRCRIIERWESGPIVVSIGISSLVQKKSVVQEWKGRPWRHSCKHSWSGGVVLGVVLPRFGPTLLHRSRLVGLRFCSSCPTRGKDNAVTIEMCLEEGMQRVLAARTKQIRGNQSDEYQEAYT